MELSQPLNFTDFVMSKTSRFTFREYGFTLVELLVTISIIGVLASITVVSVGNVRQIARDSKRLADIKQLQTALEFFFNTTNGYPLSAIGYELGTTSRTILCVTTDSNVGFTDVVTNCANGGQGPVYMSRVPANPSPGGVAYVYKASADARNSNKASTYTIEFQLETDMAGFTRATTYVATPAGIRKP